MKALVALEQSEQADRVVSFAADLLDADDQVLVVNVIGAHAPEWTAGADLAAYGAIHPGWAVARPVSVGAEVVDTTERDQSAALTGHAAAELGNASAVTEVGDPVEEIVDLATEHGVDLVIVGTEDPGLMERILTGGSVSRDIVNKAPCSVLVVR